MSDNKGYTVLDGTNPTLDASDLSYELQGTSHVLRHRKNR